MTSRATPARSNSSGMTLVELMVVVGIIAIGSAIALPKLLGASQLISSAAIPREIVAHLRFARQQAMSQRSVYTFRYDDQTKQITIINHNESGITFDPVTNGMVRLPGNAALSADVTPDTIVERFSLPQLGVASGDITLGKPVGALNVALSDGTQMVNALPGAQINITFQPDGSIVNAQNLPLARSLFIFNQKIPDQTAFAISVLGTTGRIKTWRYNSNAGTYVE